MCIVVDSTTQQYFSLTSLLQVYFVNRHVSVTMPEILAGARTLCFLQVSYTSLL